MWWCPSEEQQHPDKPWHPSAAAHSAEIYQPTALYRKYHGKVKPYVLHLQTTEPPVLHSSDKAGWLGEVGRQCLVTPIIQRYHQRPPLHSWHGFAKIQKHSEDQIPPLESSPPLLPRSSFPVSVSFLHALAPRLCLALVCHKFTVNT